MSDLIRREDVIKVISELPEATYEYTDVVHRDKAIDRIESIPSAERKGEWVAKTENYHSHWVCSECGAWALLEYNEQMCLSNFCPHCGARMKGAEDD